LAKRVNYGFGKRQKEIKRKQKQEAKAEKRKLKKEAADATSADTEDGAFEGHEVGDSEPSREGAG